MRLNYRRTFFIGLAFMSVCAFTQLYETIVPLMLAKTFSLGETATGAIMAIDNVLALFLMPVFGALSDKTKTRFGKRTPYIIAGTVLTALSMMLLPLADRRHNFVLYIAALFIVLVVSGSYRSPAVAVMPDFTPAPLRSRANAIINVMGTLGFGFTLIMISLLLPAKEFPDYTPVFIAVASFMVFLVMIFSLAIREKDLAGKLREEYPQMEDEEAENMRNRDVLPKSIRKSRFLVLASIFLWFMAFNAVTTAFSRYAVKIWRLQGGQFANILIVMAGCALAALVPIGMVSDKLGKKKTIVTGIAVLSSAYLCAAFFTEYSPMIYVAFALIGIGWAAINVNSYPMVVEMCGASEVGKFTGLYYTFSMAGQIVTPILSGFLLEKVSYRTLFPYAAVFSVFSLCTMLAVKRGDTVKSNM